jgi:hypothetical protein
MKQVLFIVFLSLIFCLNIKAQDSEEISQLLPCPIQPKPTKSELKWIKKHSGDIIDPSAPVEIFVGIENRILPNGKKVSLIKSQTSSYELVWTDFGEKGFLVSKLNFFIKISSKITKNENCFKEIVRLSFNEEEVKKNIPILYQKSFELSEGKYTLVFLIRDIETGKTGLQKMNFEVK